MDKKTLIKKSELLDDQLRENFNNFDERIENLRECLIKLNRYFRESLTMGNK